VFFYLLHVRSKKAHYAQNSSSTLKMPRVSLKLDKYRSRSLPFRSNLKKCLIKRHFTLLFFTQNRKNSLQNVFSSIYPRLTQSKHNPMPAFWILPLNILMRAPDSAASAFVAAFVPHMHPYLFPLINFRGAKDRTNFIRTMVQTNIGIHNGEM
jgi:hypothetical protein